MIPPNQVTNIDRGMFDALGVVNRGLSWQGQLSQQVVPVAIVYQPQGGGGGGAPAPSASSPSFASFARARQQAAVGTEYGKILLKNPASSTKLVYLDRVIGVAGAAGGWHLERYDPTFGTGPFNGLNRTVGGAVSTGLIYTGSSASQELGDVFYLGGVPAANEAGVIDNLGMVLGPGVGVIAGFRTINVTWTVTFEWREVPIV